MASQVASQVQQSIPMARILKLERQDTSADVYIARRTLAGDVEAFNEVYRQNLSRVYAVCLRMVADKDVAGELVQEVLVKAWETLSQYRGDSPLSAWIHRIAVNVVLDYLRAQKRMTSRMEFSDELEAYDGPGDSSHPDLHMDLEQALAMLPPQARAVVVLHDVEGYSHEEISRLMEIAVGTSKAHLHAARKKLKEALRR